MNPPAQVRCLGKDEIVRAGHIFAVIATASRIGSRNYTLQPEHSQPTALPVAPNRIAGYTQWQSVAMACLVDEQPPGSDYRRRPLAPRG